ncbi:hypothetical protein D3C73_1305160 [compost metagenome]
MEVKAAQACRFGQFVQCRQRLGAFDLAARGGHGGSMLCGDSALIRGRALAWAITRGLGLFGVVEEFDILRFRQAREAAGVAVDPGGLHRVDKLSVRLWIAGEHRGPAWIILGADGCRLACHGFTSVVPFAAD